jgi:deazaflavin-dependent oxidoreductase (nitroreductase family)
MDLNVNLKDEAAKVVNLVHRNLFEATKGRLGGTIAGMPAIVLRTTGRKTGKQRSTMLTVPLQDGERLVLVASYGGDDRNPTWFLNLRDDPSVRVVKDGREREMRARVAAPEEKAELWPRVTERYSGYAGYQTRTDRDIPLVILEPA